MIEAHIKKRKVSKKTKRSWRKHVDINDVDRYLDNARLEERLGTPFAKRKNEELFTIDKSPEREIISTKLQRRLSLKNKEPKCFALLKPLTAVPDPISKRNRVRTPEERRNPIAKKKDLQRKLNNQLKLKERLAIKNRHLAEEKRSNRPKRGEFKVDIWENDSIPIPKLNKEWLTNDTLRHTLTNIGQKRKIKPSTLSKKPSVLPAIDVPHPGTSYNPAYHDHQELLAEIVEKEKKLIKEEEHLNRVTSKIFKKVTQAEKDENQLKELSEGLPSNKENNNQDSDTDNDSTVKSVNPPVKNVKKTLKKRRKQKEQKQLALERAHKKIEKKKIADVYKLRALNNHLAFKEKKQEILRQKRQKIKERKALEPKVLSRIKFEPLDPDFQLGEELSGNLRNSQPVGNLLKDRYKSLQQRSIVAPGSLVLKHSKAKVKNFIKPDHKIDWK